jgi:hypothetical protein
MHGRDGHATIARMRYLLLLTMISTVSAQVSVVDFGAKGDGKTDDTAAFQKAIDSVAGGGGVVLVPRGQFLIGSHIVVKKNVVLKGIFEKPTTHTQSAGSTLLAVDDVKGLDGEPFITLHENATLKGLSVFYPNQSDEKPKPYPWCVRGQGDNCTIADVLLVNPYAAVDFGTHPCGRHMIDGLYAQALYRGIFIDKCFDVGRISNVHLWPFWTEKLMKWTSENGIAFIIARTDWEYMRDCFDISYKIGYQFMAVKDGPGNAVLTQCGSDIGPCAVQIDATQAHAGVSFVNGQFMAGVKVSPTNQGPVKFTACGFWGVQNVTKTHADLQGKGQVSFENCHFTGWDQAGEKSPAIRASGGGLSVIGCDFMDEKKLQIVIEQGLDAAVIMGNRLRGLERIENRSSAEVEKGLNVKK